MEVIVWVGYITGRSRAPRCPLFMQGLQARPHAEHQILLQLSAADQPAHQRGTVTQRWAAAAQERAWRTAATGRMAAARAAALRASSSARRRASCSSAALACACVADARASAYGTCPNPNPVSHTAPAARPPPLGRPAKPWRGRPGEAHQRGRTLVLLRLQRGRLRLRLRRAQLRLQRRLLLPHLRLHLRLQLALEGHLRHLRARLRAPTRQNPRHGTSPSSPSV